MSDSLYTLAYMVKCTSNDGEIRDIAALLRGQISKVPLYCVCTDVYTHARTVKPVHNDHSRDQVMVVSCRPCRQVALIYRDALVPLKWTTEQPIAVPVDRWSS